VEVERVGLGFGLCEARKPVGEILHTTTEASESFGTHFATSGSLNQRSRARAGHWVQAVHPKGEEMDAL